MARTFKILATIGIAKIKMEIGLIKTVPIPLQTVYFLLGTILIEIDMASPPKSYLHSVQIGPTNNSKRMQVAADITSFVRCFALLITGREYGRKTLSHLRS